MILSENYKAIISKEIHAAELRISIAIGKYVHLKLAEPEKATKEDMFVLIGVIAAGLGKTMDDYYESSKREAVDMKALAVMFIRKHYSKTTLQELAHAIGLTNHASVINLLNRGADMLETGEEVFCEKYTAAAAAIDNWINNLNNG